MDATELLELKKKIETTKADVAKLEGRQEQLKEELETKWNCKTVDAGEKKLKRLTKEIEKIQKDIDESLSDLEYKLKGEKDEGTD